MKHAISKNKNWTRRQRATMISVIVSVVARGKAERGIFLKLKAPHHKRSLGRLSSRFLFLLVPDTAGKFRDR